jgi:hypothetical protein
LSTSGIWQIRRVRRPDRGLQCRRVPSTFNCGLRTIGTAVALVGPASLFVLVGNLCRLARRGLLEFFIRRLLIFRPHRDCRVNPTGIGVRRTLWEFAQRTRSQSLISSWSWVAEGNWPLSRRCRCMQSKRRSDRARRELCSRPARRYPIIAINETFQHTNLVMTLFPTAHASAGTLGARKCSGCATRSSDSEVRGGAGHCKTYQRGTLEGIGTQFAKPSAVGGAAQSLSVE